MSPSTTPTAKGQALAKPPDRLRAVSATQTGPGMAHKSAIAPAYSSRSVGEIVIASV